MKKNIKFLLIVLFGLFILTSCNGDEKPKEKTFEVVFDLNYDNAQNTPPKQTITEGQKPTAPNTPVREGYKFIGWFDAKTGGEEYRFNTDITKNTTLYARWEETSDEVIYYLAGSFNGYKEDHQDYILEKVEGEENLYTITVELTDENKDKQYDGHYYKVTEGSWDADKCFGVDYYYIDPAPQSPTGGGMGSIWHWADGTLEVIFNAETKEIEDTLTISEEIIEDVYGIYGEFNGWDIEGENAILLTDEDNDGIYEAQFEILEKITSDVGFVLNKKWFDDQYGQRWGANVQYKLDGTAAGMGNSDEFEFEEGTYFVTYNSKTQQTTIVLLEDGVIYEYENPRIYGEFNSWKLDNDNDVFFLSDEDNDGIYKGVYTFAEETTSDFSIVLSKKWFDDEWGQRWGAEEQYTLDGNKSGMGVENSETFEKGTYLFVYNTKTKETKVTKIEKDLVYEFLYPRIYGAFNSWVIDDSGQVLFLTDEDNDGIYEAIYTFKEETTTDIQVVLAKKWYDDEWGQRWGAEEQYNFDGSVVGTVVVEEITFHKGDYLFIFDSKTNKTTYFKLEGEVLVEFDYYRVYGAFNGWDAFGPKAVILSEKGEGLFVGEIEIDEKIETDLLTVLSKKWYDDEWGQRWGAEEQYNFDGSESSAENPKKTLEAGVYTVTYNSTTKELTLEERE